MTIQRSDATPGEVDIVIVGAGSAGCVLARRLAEAEPARQVALLEAGEQRGNFVSDIPGMTIRLIGQPQTDWCYQAEPDPSIGGRALPWSGGRMLGGSSSINGLVYIRGLRRDFDDWASAGCSGWSWTEVEPWFQKAEGFEDEGHASLGRDGPYAVSCLRSPHPTSRRFVEACGQVGLSTPDDYNRGDRAGAFVNLTSQSRGRRSSTANRYLAPSIPANLRVVMGALVDKVLFEGARATGVRVILDGQPLDVRARGQVILSAGTLQSPAILLRSGIGPGSQLREMGIEVRVGAPDVGRNLQDHPGLSVQKFVNLPTYNSEATGWHALRHLVNYLVFRRGPLASSAVQAMCWARSDPALAEPDIHLNWLPFGVDYSVAPPALHKRPCVSLGVCVSRPHSRGEVRLRSALPQDKPVIDHRLLGDERDLRTIERSLTLIERIYAAPALAELVIGPCDPPEEIPTETERERFVRGRAGIGYHPVGTCRIGSDVDSVVDPQLQVRGVERLRVVDASVMPRLISANVNAAAIMIAERGADLVARDLG